MIGGHLPFIPHELRVLHVQEAVRVLKPWGMLLTALYFYSKEPPKEMVSSFNELVGTHLDSSGDYKQWNGLFSNLLLQEEYESMYEITSPDEDRSRKYLENLSEETRQGWKEYLRLFSENGKYVQFFVKIFRKVPNEDSVQIQEPRGGIYTTNQISKKHF